MSKIARYAGNLKAFGSEAQGLERTVFGETTQADDLTSQVTSAFLRGWGVVGPSEHPSLEDFNAAMYAMSQFIAYQHQMGVPEWHAEQEYYVGSICSFGGDAYVSLNNSNVGNQPPSAQWTKVITVKNGGSALGLGSVATENRVPIDKGGTGAATADAARRNLGLGQAATQDVVPVANGGTGANNATTARVNLGLGSVAARDVGTANSTYIPDMSTFDVYKNPNGWQKLPSGMIIQWGKGLYADGAIVNFPTAFPSSCVAVTISSDPSDNSGRTEVPQAYPLNATSFRTGCSTFNAGNFFASSLNCTWIAIGF